MQFHVKLRKLYARICSRVRKKVTKSHVLFYIFKLVFSLCIYGRLVLLTFCYCVYSLPLPRCVFLLYRRIMLQSLCATHSLSELYEESKTSRFVNFSLNDKNSNSLYRQRVRIFVVALQCMIQSCLRRGRHKFYNFFIVMQPFGAFRLLAEPHAVTHGFLLFQKHGKHYFYAHIITHRSTDFMQVPHCILNQK